MISPLQLAYVAVGSALGGMMRAVIGAYVQGRAGTDFPWGTLLINVTGSFILGVVLRYVYGPPDTGPAMRALLATGFCGGYTTFSTFSYETLVLFQDGDYRRAGLYVVASLALSLAATFAGMEAARVIS
ncbi:MAG: fluoride efflux transporter CrcB [Gemmatimonadaceae bacterium]